MTERGTKSHPASGARILAGGLAVAATVGLTGTLALSETPPQPDQVVQRIVSTRQPQTVIIVQTPGADPDEALNAIENLPAPQVAANPEPAPRAESEGS